MTICIYYIWIFQTTGTEIDYIIVIKDRRDAEQIKETALAMVGKTLDFFESDEFKKEEEDALLYDGSSVDG